MYQTTSLGHADAQKAIEIILAEFVRRGKAGVIAVADPHGELIALLRMDGAPVQAVTVATNKAFTAARARKPSRDVGQRVRSSEDGYDIAYHGDPRFVGWGGGVPVLVDGLIVGAVAVSGLPEQEDMQVAAIGVQAITG